MAKFTYFGFDAFAPCLERLLNDGHELVRLYSFFTDNKIDFNQRVINLAVGAGASVSFHKPTAEELAKTFKEGCELFIAAGYAYKVPPLPDGARGMNLHPTLLPAGRSKFPLPHVIQHHPEAGGVTLHKMTQEFDAGDILLQKAIFVTDQDDLETLSAKIVRDGPNLISEVVRNIDHYWDNATPQDADKASKWEFPTTQMRTIRWDMKICDIDKIGRAYSRAGWLCHLQGTDYWVHHYKAWEERHSYNPGDVAAILDREILVAAADGFVCLKDFVAK